jgi:hypothetical protein
MPMKLVFIGNAYLPELWFLKMKDMPGDINLVRRD